MAAKRKRGISWEYIIKRKGLLVKPITLTFRDEVEGDEYVAKLEKLLDAGIVPDEFKAKRDAILVLGQAIDQYVEAVHITGDDVRLLETLHKQLRELSIDQITYPWAEGWIAGMRDSGLSPSTIRHYVGALARCLDWLVRRSGTMLAANPLRMLPKRYATTAGGKKDVERDRRLQEGEEARILAVLNRVKPEGRERPLDLPEADALRLMFTLALETAMRMREIYTLSWAQIDLKKSTIFLERTKNGDSRQVPLSSVALKALKAFKQKTGQLFPWVEEGADEAALRTITNRLSHQWQRIFSAAGCDDLRFHDLRHEATSRLFERTNLSDIEISRVTGHKSLQMLRRYSNLRGSDLATRLW